MHLGSWMPWDFFCKIKYNSPKPKRVPKEVYRVKSVIKEEGFFIFPWTWSTIWALRLHHSHYWPHHWSPVMVRLAKLPDLEPKKQSWKLRVCTYCYNEFVGCSLELLVSMHVTSTEVAATSSTGDCDCLSRVPRFWGWLIQQRWCQR
jgi:hypothetical protein